MAPKKTSVAKRARLEQQAAERAADGMVETMANFSDLALERELESLTTHLRANPSLLYSLSSYVRDGTLEALMNGTLSRPEIAAPAAKPAKDALKPKQKKWKHITEAQWKRVCIHLMPDWEQQALEPGQTFTEIGMVLLGVKADDNLPFMTYPWCTTWTELLKASKMRYDALGKRFEGMDLSALFGLWKITDDKKAKCALNDAAVSIPLAGPDSTVVISDAWDRNAKVTVTSALGRITCVLHEIFLNADIALWEDEGDGGAWELEDYEEPSAPADDDDAVSVASGASGSSASSAAPKATPQMLSQALRARMRRAVPDAGNASAPLPPP